jgi:NAD(P)-dependent dehydrogenase (short-subunit alcohol dehydrogenase family)
MTIMGHERLFSLEGRTALITGGGTGIGGTIAHALSDQGARIILVGRRRDVLKTALGERAGYVCAIDLMEKTAAESVAAFCADTEAMPDILVNAAGINPRKHADSVTRDEWNATLHLNLSVPFFLAQRVAGAMADKRWGRIINIASLQSSRALENGIAYGASKGGVSQLTRAMAEAWSSRGITANAIAPGFFPTELTTPVFSNPETAAMHSAKTAIGRNGALDDLVGPAIFLASDASGYVTGQVLYVDGGYTAK